MKKDYYVYPAIFTYEDDGISVEFPDLPGCLTCADTTEEAIKMAKEALGLHLYDIEEENEHIPGVSSINDLSLEKNQIPILIDINMVLHRKAIENTSVKKTLTIPQWLNKEAERHNINFSQVLQEALKEQLNFK
ncbi:type II toxin-antitoxin system HicB family antitoxin [Intestinibacter sp.]|uniref:type II toxin-antitoxin system HicB family antitoxin n=1 Tax=Intestinibacter sp. TaxID=1965304 RepID=UPI002A75AFB9|nr:type II toxin-antitoxin system HicB family antitoxin [Intestinibacter sp.]MDY2736341.1 type II toxin-antitoxin system HicB family antitoxin [Intestinibacter sp.]